MDGHRAPGRAGVAPHLVERDELAVVRRDLLLPEQPHRLEVLVHPLTPVGELHAHGAVLLGQLADTDAEQDAAPGQGVERRHRLGEHGGLVLGDDHDVRAELDRRRVRGDERQPDERVGEPSPPPAPGPSCRRASPGTGWHLGPRAPPRAPGTTATRPRRPRPRSPPPRRGQVPGNDVLAKTIPHFMLASCNELADVSGTWSRRRSGRPADQPAMMSFAGASTAIQPEPCAITHIKPARRHQCRCPSSLRIWSKGMNRPA